MIKNLKGLRKAFLTKILLKTLLSTLLNLFTNESFVKMTTTLSTVPRVEEVHQVCLSFYSDFCIPFLGGVLTSSLINKPGSERGKTLLEDLLEVLLT
jgi:hypothetical protein